MIFKELPLPRDIAPAPELASLAILDTALEVAGSALVAANPELGSLMTTTSSPARPASPRRFSRMSS